jgi:hypothetical protein
MFPQVISKIQPPCLALFTWNVPENILFGDEIYARIHGIPDGRLAEGAEIEEVIGLMLGRQIASEWHSRFMRPSWAGIWARSTTALRSTAHCATCRRTLDVSATKKPFLHSSRAVWRSIYHFRSLTV